MQTPSEFLSSGFLILSGIVFLAVIAIVHRAAWSENARTAYGRAMRVALVASVWLLVTGGLAAARKLTFESRPPSIMMAIVVAFFLVGVASFGRFGTWLRGSASPAHLVLLQAFRFPLELLMHRAAEEGVMPPQMSYTGWNFDIVTGVSAIVLAIALQKRWLAGRSARTALVIWNLAGTLMVLNVVTIAILSAPLPFRVFMNEPANVWITYFPFVWLPAFLVPVALVSHLVIWRKLRTAR